MTNVLALMFAIQTGLFVWFAKWLTSHLTQRASEENMKLVVMADSAMAHLKSKSIEEKVRAEAVRKQYDLQLEYLRDTYAKEAVIEKEKKKAEKQEPTFVTDLGSGKQVDFNEVDWME